MTVINNTTANVATEMMNEMIPSRTQDEEGDEHGSKTDFCSYSRIGEKERELAVTNACGAIVGGRVQEFAPLVE